MRRLDRLVERARHHRRTGRHKVATLQHHIVAAVASRGGTEAALGYHIKAMTRLAQRRAVRKSMVRAARSGFAWPAHGRVTQPYGCTGFPLEPPRGSCAHFHDGIDIAAYQGAPIRAAATGVVAYVGWNPWDRGRRAFMVVIGHAGGFETLYGHLLPLRPVPAGRLVRKGEIIGYMGSTGHSTGPHVHWEVSRGFVTMDPLGVA
jgi:murein DD-endopeptidase MepM/ murein hydrolase activator NlpD